MIDILLHVAIYSTVSGGTGGLIRHLVRVSRREQAQVEAVKRERREINEWVDGNHDATAAIVNYLHTSKLGNLYEDTERFELELDYCLGLKMRPCGALTKKGKRCKHDAGFGTNHPGHGLCRRHEPAHSPLYAGSAMVYMPEPLHMSAHGASYLSSGSSGHRAPGPEPKRKQVYPQLVNPKIDKLSDPPPMGMETKGTWR